MMNAFKNWLEEKIEHFSDQESPLRKTSQTANDAVSVRFSRTQLEAYRRALLAVLEYEEDIPAKGCGPMPQVVGVFQEQAIGGDYRVPRGWRLVPIEPTDKMIYRGHHRVDFDRSAQNTFDPHDENQRGALRTGSTCAEDLREAYQAMLGAAPKVCVPRAADAGQLALLTHCARPQVVSH